MVRGRQVGWERATSIAIAGGSTLRFDSESIHGERQRSQLSSPLKKLTSFLDALRRSPSSNTVVILPRSP